MKVIKRTTGISRYTNYILQLLTDLGKGGFVGVLMESATFLFPRENFVISRFYTESAFALCGSSVIFCIRELNVSTISYLWEETISSIPFASLQPGIGLRRRADIQSSFISR